MLFFETVRIWLNIDRYCGKPNAALTWNQTDGGRHFVKHGKNKVRQEGRTAKKPKTKTKKPTHDDVLLG